MREFPRVPTVVLVGRHAHLQASEILALGSCGVRHVVDLRVADGWKSLREAVAATATLRDEDLAMRALGADLTGVPADLARFVDALFSGYTGPKTVRDLAAALGVLPSTLVSRFYRAGLPAPKLYLTYAGFVRAARLLENPGFSIADVSTHLNHSSPQSFARHIRTYLGMSAGQFRRAFNGTTMMQRFRAELILPYQGRLRSFSPLAMRARGSRMPIVSGPLG